MKLLYKYILFFLIFAILGFSREFLFVHINQYLYSVYYHFPDPYLPEALEFIKPYNYETIYYSKFALTVIYYLAYFMTSYYCVKSISENKHLLKTCFYIFLLILVFSSILTAYNYFINNNLGGNVYTVSRWLMGIAQSPLIALFLIASDKIQNQLGQRKI
jgi:hypothetical protein